MAHHGLSHNDDDHLVDEYIHTSSGLRSLVIRDSWGRNLMIDYVRRRGTKFFLVAHWLSYVVLAAVMLPVDYRAVEEVSSILCGLIISFVLACGAVALIVWVLAGFMLMWRVSVPLWRRREWTTLILVLLTTTLGATIAYFATPFESDTQGRK